MAFAWRDELSVGLGLIDDDHKTLVGLANEVDSVKPGPETRERLAGILDRLHAYTLVHFQREERLQAAAGFVNASAHGRHHAAVLRDLESIRDECRMDPSDSRPARAVQWHVSDLLHDWLVDHIVRSDALMRPFVADMRCFAEDAVSLHDAVRLREVERRDADPASAVAVRVAPY